MTSRDTGRLNRGNRGSQVVVWGHRVSPWQPPHISPWCTYCDLPPATVRSIITPACQMLNVAATVRLKPPLRRLKTPKCEIDTVEVYPIRFNLQILHDGFHRYCSQCVNIWLMHIGCHRFNKTQGTRDSWTVSIHPLHISGSKRLRRRKKTPHTLT